MRRDNTITKLIVMTLLCLAGCASTGVAASSRTAGGEAAAGEPTYSRKGADTCLKCHDEDYAYPILPIFASKHAQMADSRTPFAQAQCESCHGPGGQHAKLIMPGESRPPMINFGRDAKTPKEKQNAMCLQCHTGKSRTRWHGSTHDNAGLSCADCHRAHAGKGPMLVRAEQPEVCYRCHKRQRAQTYRASVHPIRYGKMACSECHNVHGGTANSPLVKPTLNETCYTCHPEKRGPFLWEHAPVVENCTLCHRPHGSNHAALLNKKTPFLCQQCHSQAGHPAAAYNSAGLPVSGASRALLAEGCLNCHSQIHGSNHPSGVKLMR